MIKQIVNYFIKFSRTDTKNHIKTKREFKTFYRKGIGVLLKSTSGNIKKKGLKTKELVKGDKRAT